MKKFLLSIIPISATNTPEIAIPSLVAQLREKNYKVSVKDFSIDFFYHIYNEKYLKNAVETAQKQFIDLKERQETFYNKNNSPENELLTQKYNILQDFFQNHIALAEKVPTSIEKAIKIVKTEELFYNPKLLQFADQVFQYAKKIACLPYAPFDFYETKAEYYEELCNKIFDRSQNIYWEYFEPQIEEIKNSGYDYIGISITFGQQVIAGLTLAYLLKKHTNAHINIGGNFFSRLTEYFQYYKDFFEIFADSISYGEGENSIVELAKYIDGEIDISEVPQLIYKDKKTGEIKQNPKGKPVIFSRIKHPDFSDIDLDKYFLPEKILPLQIQRGCYWDKCVFCSFSHSKTMTAKSAETVIEELKYYKEKYNVKSYFIIDSAITPELLEKISDKLIQEKLNLNFYVETRIEKKYNYKLLKKLHKAGIKCVWWGIESANQRVLDKMNKGIDIKTVTNVLKAADKAGILNCCFFMCGVPTATYEEELSTFEFLKRNSSYIHNFRVSLFSLLKYTHIYDNPTEYDIEIKKDTNTSRISVYYGFDRKTGINNEEILKINEKYSKYYYEKLKYYFALKYHISYCNKFGLKYVKETLFNKEEKSSFLKKLFKSK